MIRLVLLRHGQSTWNREHRFTGWSDVPLTPAGVEEARRAGRLLAGAGMDFDICFTSLLERGIETARVVLAEMGSNAALRRDWSLNERHFGALQGLGRFEAVRRYGFGSILRLQRSYTERPPALQPDDPRYPGRDALYADLDEKVLPLCESLEDTYARVVPYWHEVMAPELFHGQDLLVVAHKNSLRALMKRIENVSDERTPHLTIPTGQPLVYEFDESLQLLRRHFLSPQRRKFGIWTGISPA